MIDNIQPSLFDLQLAPTVEPARPDGRRLSIAERFAAFHEANPHVYSAMVKVCKRLRRSGRKHWSTKGAFEYLRTEWALQTLSDDGFVLNNDYTALYARLIMHQEPELEGFFETRQRKEQET